MIAFVLSGGGNYAALQVGAVQALYEKGIQPDMLVGVSAGALNAAWLAEKPGIEGVRELADVWCNLAPQVFTPFNHRRMFLRFLLGRVGLLSNNPLREFIAHYAPPELKFDSFDSPQLYIVAARLRDGNLRVFGDNPNDRLMDGLMASTALPPYFPPWQVDNEYYIDGGLVTDLPVLIAIERGATQIIALKNCHPFTLEQDEDIDSIFEIGAQSVSLMIDRQVKLELDLVNVNKGVRLDIIQLWPKVDPGFWNFTQAEGLIAAGYHTTARYLEQHARKPSRVQSFLERLEPRIKDNRLWQRILAMF